MNLAGAGSCGVWLTLVRQRRGLGRTGVPGFMVSVSGPTNVAGTFCPWTHSQSR